MSQLNELLPISHNKIGEEEVNAIDARRLHEFLNVKTPFNHWIRRRVEDCRLLENRDYIWVGQKRPTQTSSGKPGVSTQRSVILSIDAAKHISMIERTDRGFEAREYFIACEKQLKQVLSSEEKLIAAAVLSATVEERVAALSEYQRVIVQPLIEYKEEAAPKVNYHDKVLNSPDLVNISEIAKDYPISAIKLNKILQEEGVQYKDKKGEWALYAEYKDKGYASTKTQIIQQGDREMTKMHLKWTQAGRLFIYELLKTKGTLPICEQEEQ